MIRAVIVLFLGTLGLSYAQYGVDEGSTAQLIGGMSQAIEESARLMRGSLCKPGHRLKPEQWHEIRRECVEPHVHHLLTPQAEDVWRRCKDILYDICSERQYRQSQACMSAGMREATQEAPSFAEILRQAREFQEKLAGAVGVLTTMRNCYAQKLRSFGFRQGLEASESMGFY